MSLDSINGSLDLGIGKAWGIGSDGVVLDLSVWEWKFGEADKSWST